LKHYFLILIAIPFTLNAIDTNRARSWNPVVDGTVLIGVNQDNKTIWHLSIGDYQIQEDGSLLFYTFAENGEKAFAHLDCRQKYATVYWDNFNSSGKSDGTKVVDSIRDYFCFMEDSSNEKYLSYGGFLTDNRTNYLQIGWYPNKTKKNGDELILTTMTYRNKNGTFRQYSMDSSSVKLNCQNKTVRDNTGAYQYKKNDKRYDFLIDTACGKNNILEANGFQFSFNNNSQTSSTGIDKDSIKQTCRDLGFSEGTDKYGECVLQLLEK
jgi:hypothetical protein